MAARLTRQEMKRDEVLETATRFFSYITEHTRGLLLAVLAVFALVLVAVGVYAYLESRLERANEALARALAVYEADIVESGATPDDETNPTFGSAEEREVRAEELFSQVHADYSSTSVGGVARAYLGTLALERGDTAGAKEHWQAFLDSGVDHMLGTEVRLNLLAMDRADGLGDEVVSTLREQLGSEAPDLPVEIALDELGRTLEQLGRDDEAREVYQRILDEHADSPYAVRAQQRLSSL